MLEQSLAKTGEAFPRVVVLALGKPFPRAELSAAALRVTVVFLGSQCQDTFPSKLQRLQKGVTSGILNLTFCSLGFRNSWFVQLPPSPNGIHTVWFLSCSSITSLRISSIMAFSCARLLFGGGGGSRQGFFFFVVVISIFLNLFIY